MARHAAEQRESGVDEREMQRLAAQVVQQDGHARDAQRFIDEAHNFRTLEMMDEQGTGDEVKASVAKRERQSIGGNCADTVARQVSGMRSSRVTWI